ncbi:MAG: hypothetical protein CL583_03390 [Alteromonadaceae bacterium]|nr:hypothetical protein [Alteromonadaceae bacterium]|tara:strand:- start:44 stop:478 length:435 start_codon:yes stop_codon:yes gene_type:complete
MNKHSKITAFLAATVVSASLTSGAALAHDHGDVGIWGDDQSVSEGTVTAKKVMAEENGWLVVHRTDEAMKPGPVVGYAPLKKGKNMDVPAILTEEVASGDMLMLMVHSEDGGMKTGVFEYTLGAKEDGPIRKDGELVMTTVTAK